MKTIIFPFLVLISIVAHAQPNKQIEIDTLEVNLNIKKIVEVNSLVPQIKSGINSVAQKRINADIKKHFEFTPYKDSTYTNKLRDYYELESYHGFEPEEPDGITEYFTIEYLSNNILNLSVLSEIFPYRGRPGYFFKSLIYDLNNGNKLEFSDFISIPTDTLTSILNSEGFYVDWNNDQMKPVKKKISEWLYLDEICPIFYFNTIEDELYLMIKATCWGPMLSEFAIPLKQLTPYIEHFELKNELQLWGKDVNSLIGKDQLQLGNKIVFEDYYVQHIGDYLLPIDNLAYPYGISEYYSSNKRFLLLFKSEDTHQNSIMDILEIDNKEFENNILTEYCITKDGLDMEIIALVNPTENEFHTKIIKAWRANRDTGKFEKINKQKIEKCPNHSYGL